jgi:hypothetical protein
MNAEGDGAQLVKLLHTPCGTHLLWWKGPLRRGTIAWADRIVWPTGQPGQDGQHVWCETCCRLVRDDEVHPEGGWTRCPEMSADQPATRPNRKGAA